jgi:hypothetical protein
MDELGIYARGGEAKRLRRRSGDGEGVWMQKDEDGGNRRNSRNEAASNVKESNSGNYAD